MPDPTTVHIDAALTSVSVAFRNNEFIAEQVAPTVPVRKQSDRYFVLDPDKMAQRETLDHRAPGAEAREVDFALSSDSYYCEDHALETAIPDEERDNADLALQPEIDRTEFLTEKILLNREIQLETTLRTNTHVEELEVEDSGGWAGETSNPFANLDAAGMRIMSGIQRRPNTLVVGYAVFDILRNHPRIIERVQHCMPGVVTTDLLAQLFDLDRVVVGRAMKNSAPLGRSPDMHPVWGSDHVYLMYVPQRAGLKQPAAMYTFAWNGAGGGVGRDGTVVERWREDRRKADMIRVQKYYDHKVIASGAMIRLVNVT
ncbi:hypothetical protein CVU37_10015 [candidate division BRC1 bacterium HGW-BRC1-1]|jgi:hypothetical protein|nr:MAG: hypothetical protein CVU37_10015 [candidate division BRC1 bacterium HGW-BRC1-1]